MTLQTDPDGACDDVVACAVPAGFASRPAVDEYRAFKSRVYRWARGFVLTGTQRSVLRCLISSAKSDKPVRISQKAIANREGWSVPTVKRAISALKKSGAIRVEYQYNRRGKRTSSLYFLNVAQQPVPITTRDHAGAATKDHGTPSTKDHCDPTYTYPLSKTESVSYSLLGYSGGEVGHDLRAIASDPWMDAGRHGEELPQ